jgi:hypothetical protein
MAAITTKAAPSSVDSSDVPPDDLLAEALDFFAITANKLQFEKM